MHVIDGDPSASVLRLRGFWTKGDSQRCAAGFAGLPTPSGTFDVLRNAVEFPIQSAEVAKARRRLSAAADDVDKTRRKAVVLGSTMRGTGMGGRPARRCNVTAGERKTA